jgi:seryl-tRNA synthetase
MFKLANDDLFLVGTAEHALVPMFKDELLDGSKLPLRFAGYSSAFRREAGSYGKDTKGILRVHQFDKVEMVSFVKKGEDDSEHEYLLQLEEKFFQSLEIPYQVSKMCTGDLGFPAARKYDIEAWMPAQDKYREVTSVSTVTDFQSRRLKIRYRDGDSTELAYVLNGTAFAIGRTIIAILENFQAEDGSVVIPEVLRRYMGKDKITPRSTK